MKVGYVRISTAEQDEAYQETALRKAGCVKIFCDTGQSGATDPMHRPGFQAAMKALSAGGTLMVWKLDRLGRSTHSIISTIDGFPARGIEFVSLTEKIDTTTAIGRASWQIIGVFAELERAFIRERTKAGMAQAKQNGKRFGRPPALQPEEIAQGRELIALGASIEEAASRFKIGRSTAYRYFLQAK